MIESRVSSDVFGDIPCRFSNGTGDTWLFDRVDCHVEGEVARRRNEPHEHTSYILYVLVLTKMRHLFVES